MKRELFETAVAATAFCCKLHSVQWTRRNVQFGWAQAMYSSRVVSRWMDALSIDFSRVEPSEPVTLHCPVVVLVILIHIVLIALVMYVDVVIVQKEQKHARLEQQQQQQRGRLKFCVDSFYANMFGFFAPPQRTTAAEIPTHHHARSCPLLPGTCITIHEENRDSSPCPHSVWMERPVLSQPLQQ